MSVVLVYFVAGMSWLRTVTIVLMYFLYNTQIKVGEQLALGSPREQ